MPPKIMDVHFLGVSNLPREESYPGRINVGRNFAYKLIMAVNANLKGQECNPFM